MSLRTSRDLIRQLQSGQRVLADGAVGSELLKASIDPNRTVEANLSQPETVRSLHLRSLAAGAEVITANTFGLSYGDGWEAAFQAGVELANAEACAAAFPVSVLVSACPEELLRHPNVVLAPFDGAAQNWVLLLETAVAIRDIATAVSVARHHGVETVAATCHFLPNGAMPDGTMPKEAALALLEAGASLIGGNCGSDPEDWVSVAEKMRTATDLPLLFQPGAGLPKRVHDLWVYPVDADRFAANAARLFDVGVSIVGGCCGTTPAHIAAVRGLLFHPQRRE